ncbi:hypothetical protein FQR65_LT19747 [Abscondita terminalis]|nr:hypothetical protein FQR65_LT19747 [Abscondita terminalis]
MNDYEMLQNVGYGVAMKNGHDELKNIANGITTLTNDEGGVGEESQLKNLVGEKGLVLFAYPKASTSFCTQEVIEYEKKKEEFLSLGYNIAGVSPDVNWSLCSYNYYPLICDPKKEIIKELDIVGGEYIIRSTFVLDTELNVVKSMKDVQAVEHIQEVINFLKG